MKDSGGKAMLIVDAIKTVDAAIDLLGRMAGQESKSVKEILSK
jgi:transcription-repair coupling factor (superfamily II helicase)